MRAAPVRAGVGGAVTAVVLGLAAVQGLVARAQTPAPAADASVTLYLDVSLNGWPLELVASFEQEAPGRLSLPASEFEGLGFILRPEFVHRRGGEPRVYLDAVPGLTFKLDMAAQAIALTAPFDLLTPQRLQVSPAPPRVDSRADWGALVGYTVFSQYGLQEDDPLFPRTLSGDVEARVFGPRFSAGSTGFYAEDDGLIRLETWVDFARPARTELLRIGDSYTGALWWTRSFQFGGVQWRRDFGLRPDIVTQPLPEFRTGIAAPSTVDLMINGVERYGGQAAPGSLILSDVPLNTGANEVTMVVTDHLGRRQEISLPFYASTELLAPGLSDFSLEAGKVRKNYTFKSADYGRTFASGTYQRGLTSRLTARVHGEVAEGFGMAGGSASLNLANTVVVSGAVAASDGPAGRGLAYALGVERSGEVFTGTVRFARREPAFQDIPGLMGQPRPLSSVLVSTSVRPSRTQTLNASLIRQDLGPTIGKSEVISGTWSVSMFDSRLRTDLTGFRDTGPLGAWGVTLNVSFPLGARSVGTVSASRSPSLSTYEARMNGDALDGDLVWRARAGEGKRRYGEAHVDFTGRRAETTLGARKIGSSSMVELEFGQSLVWIGGHLFTAPRIDDAFAVVDVPFGAGVEVFRENRPAGRADRGGRLFIHDLRGYEANSLSIDPQGLPINAVAQTYSKVVAPRGGAGVVARFDVDLDRGALVVVTAAGDPAPPVGAAVEVEGAEGVAVLGYGGEVYLRGLKPGSNAIRVTWPEGACRATFTLPDDLEGLPRLETSPCV